MHLLILAVIQATSLLQNDGDFFGTPCVYITVSTISENDSSSKLPLTVLAPTGVMEQH